MPTLRAVIPPRPPKRSPPAVLLGTGVPAREQCGEPAALAGQGGHVPALVQYEAREGGRAAAHRGGSRDPLAVRGLSENRPHRDEQPA